MPQFIRSNALRSYPVLTSPYRPMPYLSPNHLPKPGRSGAAHARSIPSNPIHAPLFSPLLTSPTHTTPILSDADPTSPFSHSFPRPIPPYQAAPDRTEPCHGFLPNVSPHEPLHSVPNLDIPIRTNPSHAFLPPFYPGRSAPSRAESILSQPIPAQAYP